MTTPGPLRVKASRRLGEFQLDVAFEADATGVTVLFGPSGAGKSQTLAAIAGALRPDLGRIALGDEVLFDAAARIDVAMERRRIGWVFQDGRLFPHLSVEANLRYGQRRALRGETAAGTGTRADFAEVVDILDIAPLLARRPLGLSGGERQRVAIGRALLARPRLLLMDEPLAALDARRRAGILPYLERLKTALRLPILYVTHAMVEVVRLADRLVVIEAGRVRAQGPLVDLLAEGAPGLAPRPQDAMAVIEGRVAARDGERGLSWVETGALRIVVPSLAPPLDAPIRVAVLARDVLLAREKPGALSARNVLPGRIESLAAGGESVVLARVRLDGGPVLWSAITPDAVAALALAPGVEVFAIVKSLAVEGGPSQGLLPALDV